VDRTEYRRRLAQRPNAVRFEELERLLVLYGWELDRTRGSHFNFRRGSAKLVVPFRRPSVLAVYVRDALKRTAADDEDQD
jgi:predicted RNA binding protein YcfA (HicA-like mRNA interferase family)